MPKSCNRATLRKYAIKYRKNIQFNRLKHGQMLKSMPITKKFIIFIKRNLCFSANIAIEHSFNKA